MGRYENEVIPVVFKMLAALEAYVTRIGIQGQELDRAIAAWLAQRRYRQED